MSLKKIYDKLSMSGYALLSEVYGDLQPKKRGKKKSKNKVYDAQGYGRDPTESERTMPQPLSPQTINMESELLSPMAYDAVNSPYRPVKYSSQENTQPRDSLMQNKHIMRIDNYSQQLQDLPHYKVENDPTNPMGIPVTKPASGSNTKRPAQTKEEINDPEYLEFLEYKRMKHKHTLQKVSANSHDMMTSSDQFNELLLYVFTGLLLLFLYDHIYKLGRDTSFY